MEIGCNMDEPVRDVRHSDLKRYGDSVFKSVCPACSDGILLVYRDQQTFKLQEGDRCVACGQAFRYTDIDEIRSMEEPAGRSGFSKVTT